MQTHGINLCDDCQSTLVKREDDTEEIFESRYQVYLDETKPLIDFYAKENVLYRIDGNLDKMSIFNEIAGRKCIIARNFL